MHDHSASYTALLIFTVGPGTSFQQGCKLLKVKADLVFLLRASVMMMMMIQAGVIIVCQMNK